MKIHKLAMDQEISEIPEIPEGVPEECTNNDCFEAAGKYMMDQGMFGGLDLVLVHGIVTGQGKIEGVKYLHGWVENGEEVIDNTRGRHVRMPKAIYYLIGNIEKTIRYSMADMRRKINESGHWGPWDL